MLRSTPVSTASSTEQVEVLKMMCQPVPRLQRVEVEGHNNLWQCSSGIVRSTTLDIGYNTADTQPFEALLMRPRMTAG